MRMPVTVNDGFGTLHLVLRCSGLRPAATAKLLVRPAIRRTFRLRGGSGSGHVGELAVGGLLAGDPR